MDVFKRFTNFVHKHYWNMKVQASDRLREYRYAQKVKKSPGLLDSTISITVHSAKHI